MKEGIVKFKNFNRSMEVPFVVYADFEALNTAVKPLSKTAPSAGKTESYQKHHTCGFCFQIVCFDEKITFDPVFYRAENEEEVVGEVFVGTLENEIKRIHKTFNFSKKMIFTEEDKNFEEAEVCWICREEFVKRKKLGIIATSQESSEELHMRSAIFSSRSRSSRQWFFTTFPVMIHIYSLKTWGKIQER